MRAECGECAECAVKEPREFVVRRKPRLPGPLLSGKESGLSPFQWATGLVTTHTRGRYALYHGVRALGLGSEDEVLVPEFHCMDIMDALQASGVRVVFHRVKETSEVDLEDLESRVTGRTRALLIVHYFGLPQNSPELRDWCDRHGLFLIEDCAHSLFATLEGKPLGSWGDVSVFSILKTLPTQDGGLMVLKDPDRKYAFDARRQRLRGLAKGAVKSLVLRRPAVMQAYEPAEEYLKMHPLSERALKCADADGIASSRRRNYRYLAEALRDGELVVPYLPALPEGACPFIFPVRVTRDVRRVHAELVIRGIPVCVFPGHLHPSLPRESFPLAWELADSLLALPCHQDLSTADLDRVVEIVRSVD